MSQSSEFCRNNLLCCFSTSVYCCKHTFRYRLRPETFDYTVVHCSGAHPASYPMGTGVSFPGVKRPEHEANHSPTAGVEVKNAWSYTSTPQYVFMSWCLVKHRDNFTFTLPHILLLPTLPHHILAGRQRCIWFPLFHNHWYKKQRTWELRLLLTPSPINWNSVNKMLRCSCGLR
jgi:hypothetical protein